MTARRRASIAFRRAGAIVTGIALGLMTPLAGGNPVAGARTAAPIRVMTIGDFGRGNTANPVWSHAVEARFAGANVRGGILDARGRRHHVAVVPCDSGVDTRSAAGCARQAVRMRAAAVIGMNAVDSAAIWPTLERADIPVIGSRINTIADATSQVAFPLSAGLPGSFSAMPQALSRAGARTIGVVISEYGAATDALLAFVERGLAHTDAALGPVVRVPLDATSLAGAAEVVTAGGTDGIIGFVSGPGRGSLLDQLARVHFAGSYVTQAPFGSTPLASDPSVSQSALLVGQFAPVSADVPGMAEFRVDMDESPQGAALARTEGAVNGWLAARVFERVVRHLPTIDAGAVLRAMNRLDHLGMGGITPALTTTTPNPFLPRMFNPTVTFNYALGGVTSQQTREFIDPFDGTMVAP